MCSFFVPVFDGSDEHPEILVFLGGGWDSNEHRVIGVVVQKGNASLYSLLKSKF